jgi:hypothetical protein
MLLMSFMQRNESSFLFKCNSTKIDIVFSDMVERYLEVFMDDFLVFSCSFKECLYHLNLVLIRCKEKNLILNWEKCHFMVKQGVVLGHVISPS